MALTSEGKEMLLSLIKAQDELPIEMLPAVVSGQKPDELSVLYQKSKSIKLTPKGSKEAQEIVEQMSQVLTRYREITGTGRAMAASQIGILKKVVVFLHPDGTLFSYINPEITFKSKAKNVYWEMCMSGAPLGVDVVRPVSVKVRWSDLAGKEHHELLDSFDARRMQHEIDHLNGKVCYNTTGTIHSTLGYGLDSKVYLNQELRPQKNKH